MLVIVVLKTDLAIESLLTLFEYADISTVLAHNDFGNFSRVRYVGNRHLSLQVFRKVFILGKFEMLGRCPLHKNR